MVAAPFIDPSTLNIENPVMTREELQEYLPQRHEFAQLDAVLLLDREREIIVAYKDLVEDEWWARGHIPGRPLLPGVMMIEAAAQTGAILFKLLSDTARESFIGFGGLDNARFRGVVEPPARIFYMAAKGQFRSRVATMPAQAVVDGRIVFEGKVLGAVLQGF